jgi:hypothetical protein
MEHIANLEVLFFAGFDPMVRDPEGRRKLYRDVPGIRSGRKERRLSAYLRDRRRKDVCAVAARSNGGITIRE